MTDGQLPWGLVIAIAFAAASLQIVDYFWRVTVLPFHTFVLWAACAEVAAAAVVFGAFLLIRRRTAAATRSDLP